MSKARIGVIGMAVMGRSIALNMADHGFEVCVFNRTAALTDAAVDEDVTGRIIPTYSIEEFINGLEKPRNILLMIKAGEPIDKNLEELVKVLDKGDLIIDGGNSYFKDTIRRAEYMNEKGIYFFGMGVSGGEEGARRGPAIMPGGDKEAYERVRDILESIAAKASDGEPCCKYTSTDGAGHYVKMVHNGIEYADMQIIAEGYSIMKNLLHMTNEEMADTFEKYNQGPLDSYLIEITHKVLREKDDLEEGYLIDKILDSAKQKGTGKWTNLEAVNLGVDTSILVTGLNSRILSSQLGERKEASRILTYKGEGNQHNKEEILKAIEDALLASKIMAYAQGFVLLREAAQEYNWTFDYKEITSIFRAGCIIRSELLYAIMEEYQKNNELVNLMTTDYFSKILNDRNAGLRKIVKAAIDKGIAAPALMSSLAYYDGYRTERSAANLVQGQRDYFGAHTFERIDRDGVFHHKWEEN